MLLWMLIPSIDGVSQSCMFLKGVLEMGGWIYLHPVSGAHLGMGWDEKYEKTGEFTSYILPGSRQVGQARKHFDAKCVEWMTFDHFVRKLMLHPARLMSPPEQHWIVQQAVMELEAEGRFSYFQSISSSPSGTWIQSLEKVLGEIKRSGILPVHLKRLWQGKGSKYQELALIYERYQQLLEHCKASDHEQFYLDVMRQMREKKISCPARVVLEHFHDLNPLQEQLLVQLVTQGTEVHHHIMWDETRCRLRTIVEPMVQRLKTKGFQVVPVSRGRKKAEKKSPALIHLAENAFSSEPLISAAESSFEILSAPGVQAETDLVVTRLKKWLHTHKADCSDVAVIMSEFDTYAPLLLQKLEEAGIPVATGLTQKLSENSLIQTIAAAFYLQAGKEEWSRVLLYSPHLPAIRERQRDCLLLMQEFDFPARSHVLKEAWQSKCEALKKLGEDVNPGMAEAVAALEAMFNWVESIPEQLTWSEWLEWFKQWVRPLKNKRQWREMAQDPARFKELTKMMNGWHSLESLIKVWEQLYAVYQGKQRMDRARFLAALIQAADQLPVKCKPAQRTGIQVLEAKQIRGDQFRAVFILGCVEGKWPRAYTDNWLLPDDERNDLRREGVCLDLSRELRQRQLVPFFMSTLAASEYLSLSYPGTDEEGKKQLPSPYLEECTAVFEPSSISRVERDLSEQAGPPGWQDCYSREKGLEFAVSQLVCSHPGEVERAVYVLHTYSQHSPRSWQSLADRITAERSRWKHQFTQFDGKIEDKYLQQHLNEWLNKQVWSATDLNKMVTCRFHFMAEKLWQARDIEQVVQGMSRLEEGELIHQVLSRFFSEYRQGKWNFRDEDQARTRLFRIADQAIDELLSLDVNKKRNPLYIRIEKQKLKHQLESYWQHEVYWRKKADFFTPPAYIELSFGLPVEPQRQAEGLLDPKSILHPVSIPLSDHQSIRLKGKIDRVDMDGEYYVLYDYKTGGTVTTQEIKEGKQLQLPLYLWALQHGFGLDKDKAIGAAFYTRNSSKASPHDHRNRGLWKKELADRVGIGKQVRSRLEKDKWESVERGIRLLIEEKLSKAFTGDFRVDPTWECPSYCPQRKVCRFDQRRWSERGNHQ
ncbi:PD-(D/E)XK nuclease family protein [Paenactinomyces guangxiensis]|uniref:PD-(D/E)XK nuclease family protein n=1 Tax=Paenactinomyces guangxiensis TaxID=1490290 RepID=A0A7W1WNC3_9BACL|nr:PD-(D/E)XK nuclease family protein [Paenactinomyces guangxiensis]MBA4492971.1 PD-(D/E)XK nuclease family protein [Paenactinomyces guangxiensis]MBH8590180.1 PD-(D/E)XK nuclease family protein [Paenactinomyces guangxiensis]